MPQTIALTATATPDVRLDVVEMLELRQPLIFVSGFARENLRFEVIEADKTQEKAARLLDFLRQTPGSGIVYASTRQMRRSSASCWPPAWDAAWACTTLHPRPVASSSRRLAACCASRRRRSRCRAFGGGSPAAGRPSPGSYPPRSLRTAGSRERSRTRRSAAGGVRAISTTSSRTSGVAVAVRAIVWGIPSRRRNRPSRA